MRIVIDGRMGATTYDFGGELAEAPAIALARLASAGASGELIIAADSIEVHIYLLDGRLAWATSSSERDGFTRRLIEHHGVAADALREVIEECQRARLRLGETLIAWGVASADQVRDALRAQIAGALAAATAHPRAQSLFLARRMRYAPELTFALDEIVAAAPASTVADAAAELVARVLDAMPEAAWVEVTSAGATVSRAVRGPARPDALAPLAAALDHDGIDALIVRTAQGAILGQRLGALPAAVWCALGPDAKLGVASVVLAGAAGVTAPPSPAPPLDEHWHERRGAASALAPAIFAGAMRTADDLIAAFALDVEAGEATGAWRRDPLEPHVARATALAPALAAPIAAALPRGSDAVSYEQLALRAVTADASYYGTRVAGAPLAVWLVLRPQASQGLGWALLQAVARQVSDATRPGGA